MLVGQFIHTVGVAQGTGDGITSGRQTVYFLMQVERTDLFVDHADKVCTVGCRTVTPGAVSFPAAGLLVECPSCGLAFETGVGQEFSHVIALAFDGCCFQFGDSQLGYDISSGGFYIFRSSRFAGQSFVAFVDCSRQFVFGCGFTDGRQKIRCFADCIFQCGHGRHALAGIVQSGFQIADGCFQLRLVFSFDGFGSFQGIAQRCAVGTGYAGRFYGFGIFYQFGQPLLQETQVG